MNQVRDAAMFLVSFALMVLAIYIVVFPLVYLSGMSKSKYAKEAVGVDLAWYESLHLDLSDIEKMGEKNLPK